MWRKVALTLVMALVVFAECVVVQKHPIQPPPKGELEVIPVDATGAQVIQSHIEVYSGDEVHPFRTMRGGENKVQLHYGGYRVKVWSTGFRSKWLNVQIDQKYLAVRASLEVGQECGPYRGSIGGKIRSAPKSGELWVKLVNVYGSDSWENRVEKNGDFLISGLPAGDFILLVLNQDAVVHQETVVTYPASKDTTHMSIDLKPR